jgi:hypothetical protein
MDGVLITKADGTEEAFVPQKLTDSLRRAGATETLAGDILKQIEKSLKPRMRTADIYRQAFSYLRTKESHGSAARYALKRAIFDFGPSGFPFEAYVAELFRARGYEAATNIMGKGRCVEHEIDVLLKKDGITTYVEAKFHNTPGFKTDLKVVLYVKARIEDIAAAQGDSVRGMVLTNTKFTSLARQYGACAGLPLMGWDYPHGEDLHTLIGTTGLYPITALASLKRTEKAALMAQKIVLCRDLPHHTEALRSIGIDGKRADKLFMEVGGLCGIPRPV